MSDHEYIRERFKNASPNVSDVEIVEVTRVIVKFNGRTSKQDRLALYGIERHLQARYTGVNFDFHISEAG